MNGEQSYLELLNRFGSIETKIESLNILIRSQEEDMKMLCCFRDEILQLKQQFVDYAKNREGLPQDIISLNSRTSSLENKQMVQDAKISALETFQREQAIVQGKLTSIFYAFGIIVTLITVLSQFIDLKKVFGA